MRVKLLVFMLFFFWAASCFAQYADTAWVRRYNGLADSTDRPSSIAVDSAGNVCVTGSSFESGNATGYCTIKYKPNGDTLWVRKYRGDVGDSWANAIAIDGSGNVFVTGASDTSTTRLDYTTIKYGSDGTPIWNRRYTAQGTGGSSIHDNATAIALDLSGYVYITGTSHDSGGGTNGWATVKYASNGDSLWVQRYRGTKTSDNNQANAITTDNQGYVYVTGWCQDTGQSKNYVTIKYYSDTGDTVWVKRYNGRDNGVDSASAIAVDDSGYVYVTGASVSSSNGYDFVTIKYKPDGDTAWVRRYNGPGNNEDNARAIAVDASGYVYVTGLSFGSGTGEDYCTIKYKPNGDTAWVRRYNGPGNAGDDAHAIAVDGYGNVYVTGESFGSGENYDYATIKYDAAGNTIWVKRYNGPANFHDYAYAIALDNSGNVYVTGESFGTGTDYDYATIKYVAVPYRTDTLEYFAYSPVDLIVTAPNGDSIGVSFNTIPNASYDTTTDRNHDGDKDDIVTIPNPLIGDYLVRIMVEPGVDTGHYTLGIRIDGSNETVVLTNATVPPPGQADTVIYEVMQYLRGDANRDGKKTVSDVVYTINYLFKGGPAPAPLSLGDVNYCFEGKEQVTVADVVYLVNYLFKGGKPPCS
ncbi:MAG TPA: SBBP repeat-containing protein [Terriglobales bacterium]|nr:SBBP repeat-containing protein [Terriglobales bacterium]